MSGAPVEAFRALLDLVERPALLVAADGETLLGNAAAARALERAERELEGRLVTELVVVEDPAALLAAVQAAAGPSTGETPVGHLSSNGRPTTCAGCRLTPLGSPPAAVLVTWRPASDGNGGPAPDRDGVGELAHSLRQPLQIIFGYAELLAHGILGPLEDRQQQAAVRVSQGILELDRCLDELLKRIAGLEL